MGWDFCDAWTKKSDVLKEQLRPGRFGPGSKLLASQSVKEGYLAVWELADGKRFLECSLVQKGRRGEGFGVKTMEESMGPCEFNGCAEVLFSLAGDPPNEYAAGFRARVRATRHAKGPGRSARVTVYPQSTFAIPNVSVGPVTP